MKKLRRIAKYLLLPACLLILFHSSASAAVTGGGGGGPLTESKTAEPGECGSNYIELGVPLDQDLDEDGQKDNCISEQSNSDDLSQNPIFKYMSVIVRFLSAGVGVVVMLMIVISGIQYITSSGNPDAVQAAKKRLTNAVLALVLFIFMAWILNVLIPGGWL